MSCAIYDEAVNGLKMLPVGLAIGAIAWFVAGSGAKEGYAKRRREREREEHDREMRRIQSEAKK